MGYYEDKVDRAVKIDPTHIGEVYKEWIEDLQHELKVAGRQIDKLDRKLAIRSRKLGQARKSARNALNFINEDFVALGEVDETQIQALARRGA